MDRKKLFSDILGKAYSNDIFPFDTKLNHLASYFTGGKHISYYLGEGAVEGNDKFQYMLLQWQDDELDKAAIAIRMEDGDNEPGYTFIVFYIDNGIPKLADIHSTEKPTKEERFDGKMGSVIAGNYATEEFIASNALISAMMVEI